MADKGSVAFDIFADRGVWNFMPAPNYAVTLLKDTKNQGGTLGGNVKISGVNTPNVEVFVLWRKTMQVAARTWTDASGNWSLQLFDPAGTSDYAVVYKDPISGTVFNDAIYALVAPV